MSGTTFTSDSDERASERGPTRAPWGRIERWMESWGDRLNPILVKETRQALKSKQFVITFGLMLLVCWLCSIIGVAIIGPEIYYRSVGDDLFFAYYIIFTFPLALIVPFSAFRSLAAEREDNTYDLLSITLIGPRQIISGKLGSAVAQIMLYSCAIAPCIAFTYLLRGIDFMTVAFLMLYAVLGSLGLSVIALFLATLSSQRFVQVILSVGVVLGLAFMWWCAGMLAAELVYWDQRYFHTEEFWISNGALLTAYVTYFALIFLAAAAQLTFASENRSSALRWVMLIQHACLACWVAYPWLSYGNDPEAIVALAICSGIHWSAMGVLMISEAPELSARAKRRLPQSFLGRAFLTWFNPGPACGYMFAVANLCCMLVLATVAAGATTFLSGNRGWGPSAWTAWCGAALVVAYVTTFLGIGNLINTLLRRLAELPWIVTSLVPLTLLLIGTLVPLVIQLMSPVLRDADYTLLQITNPFWSLYETVDDNNLSIDTTVLMLLVPSVAIFVLLANVPLIAAEVRHVRVAKPARVAEDDAAQQPVSESAPTSPWG